MRSLNPSDQHPRSRGDLPHAAEHGLDIQSGNTPPTGASSASARVAITAAALCLLGACAAPERVGAVPAPIPAAPAATSPAVSGAYPAAPSTTRPSAKPPVATTSTSPTPAQPATTCVPQYTVVADTYARDAPGGNLIGRVATNTHVNVRDSNGIWAYGYVGDIEGRGGGWAWMLHEKMHRTGEFCHRS